MDKISILKRTLAWILLLCMLAGLMPMSVLANSGSDEPKEETKAATEPMTADQIRTAIEALIAPTGGVKYGNRLVDLTGYRTVAGNRIALDILKGRYYLASFVDGSYYVFDGSVLPSATGTITARKKSADGQSLTGMSKNQTILFTLRGVNENKDSSYAIGFGRGGYLDSITEGAKIVNVETSGKHAGWIWSTDEKRVIINNNLNHAGGGYTRHCITLNADKNAFLWSAIADTQAVQAGTDYDRHYLFRFCYSLQDLYTALITMETYLDRPAGVSDEMYQHFLDSYGSALTLYNTYNVTDLTEELYLDSELIQARVDAMKKEIMSYEKLLDPSLAYLDLPIEVLDFRADGYLFENPGTFVAPYNLSQSSPAVTLPDGSTMARPGKLEWDKASNQNDKRFFVSGLVEPELVNGSIVYAPDVIKYIANALMSTAHDPGTAYNENWNDVFYVKKKSADFRLGTWEETLAKIGYTNGNPMTWEQVETAYDLAYYMLLYVWQPTEAGDYLEKNVAVNSGTMDLPYNMVIEELQYLRLYYNSSTGYYEFISTNSHSRSGGYIFNDGQNKLHTNPNFNVARDLGFENGDIFDARSTGSSLTNNSLNYKADSNFFYSLHAASKFVYYKEKNYFFDFTGDDDVYFFINDTLVCDIGGIHGSPNRSVYLEEKMDHSDLTYAEYLGLRDGDICSFDMFFADRHLTGINLVFKTNIQLLNEDVITEKHQYLVQSEGQNNVHPTTGMGEYLQDNRIVNIGDIVAYSFDLLNKGDVPVNRVSFRDEALGTEMSHEAMILSNTELTNGVSTSYGDLKLFYGPYSAKAGSTLKGPGTSITFSELDSLLREMSQPNTVDGKLVYPAFPNKIYCFSPSGPVTYTDPSGGETVTLTEAQQLQHLLELGVAANGHLKVYGICRKTDSADMPFRNVLRSACYDTVNGNVLVEGIARRAVRVPNISSDIRPYTDAKVAVIDYGKAVEIPFGSVEEDFYTAPSQCVVEFLGLTPSGSNGDLLRSLPTDMYCRTVGSTMAYGNGIYTRTAKGILFAPNKMLSQAERVYGVFSLSGCYGPGVNGTSVEYKYMLRELRIMPATVMYYETDFASGIFKLTQKGGATAWSTDTDGTSAQDAQQDYSYLAGTIYDKVIDREHIPAKSFFVDFDGTGMARRYRDQLQYRSRDFDRENAWYSHKVNNPIYNTHSLNLAAGTMELTNLTSQDSEGNKLGAWIQTIIPGDTIGSRGIGLISGPGHFAQIRFRVENCVSYASDGNISLFFSNTLDNETEGNVAMESRRARLSLSNAEVLSGNYITVKIPLDGTYYANSMSIDIIRLYIAGYTDDGSGKGKISIDYIYVGPEMGISEGVYDDYLFFDFTNTAADALRYGGDVYGKYNFDEANSDGTAVHWAGRDTNFTKGTAKISNGTLIVKPYDNAFGSIYADTQSGASNAKTHLLNYDASNAEVFQMRFKVTGITDNDAVARAVIHFYYESGSVSNPYDKHDESNAATFDSAYLNKGEYITVRGTIPQAVRDRRFYDRLIMWVGGFPDTGTSKNAVLTFDYIYIGPKSKLDEINAAQSTQDKMNLEIPKEDHLFFDFKDDDRSKSRYSNPVYGAKNFGLKSAWSAKAGYVGISSVGEGTIVLEDKTPLTNGTEGANGNIFCSAYPLNFTVGQQDYCRVRLKIENAVKDADSSRILGIRADFRDTSDKQNSSATIPISWDKVNNNQFITVDIPLSTTGYRNMGILQRFNVVVIGTQCATVTIDYIYVGSLTKGVPASQSLYFNFEDTAEDRLRYDSDTYGYSNFDSRNWILGTANGAKTFDSYPAAWIATNGTLSFNTDTGNMEATVNTGKTSLTLQTGPNGNERPEFHPTGKDVAQIRLKTENLTIGQNFSVGLRYLAGGQTSYSATETFALAPLYELSPHKEYVVFNLKLGDGFQKASMVKGIQVLIDGIAVTGTNPGKILIDYIYLGAGEMAPMPVYGYDSSYQNDRLLSNGSGYTVEGQGVKIESNPQNYTEAQFDFVGTGFDIISRTGKSQATIRVEVKEKATGNVKKTLTVNNKGEMELYQIPVVSIQGLPHGEYTVTLWVNKAVESDYEFLSRGGTFWFDAVRIYDPINAEKTGDLSLTEAQARAVYVNDAESFAYTKEVRDSLLTLAQYNQGKYTNGALFVDSNVVYSKPDYEPSGENTHLAVTVRDYNKLGPKNEVYLSPGEAVAFKLVLDGAQKPVSIDIGAKSILGDSAVLAAGFVTSMDGTVESLTAKSKKITSVGSGTAQYYELDGSKLPDSGDVYVILYNSHTGTDATKNILSVTDMKIAYPQPFTVEPGEDDNTQDSEIHPMTEDDKPALRTTASEGMNEPYSFTVDEKTVAAAEVFMNAILETPVDDTPTVDGSITIRHNLNLASDISVNYLIPATELEGFTHSRMEVSVPVYDEGIFVGEKVVYLDPVLKNGYYYFTMDGITAVRMNDELTAILYMEKDGKTYCSQPDVYSVARYAYAQLGRDGTSKTLKTLCADLLRYGAKAQILKGYRIDSLADSAMVDTHKSYLSDMENVAFGTTNKVLEDLPAAPIAWVGKALNLESKISLKLVYRNASYEGDLTKVSARISYEDVEGKTKTLTLTNPEVYNAEKGLYAFTVDCLLAAELRSVVSAQIFEGETPLSATLQYAPDAYGNNKTGTMLELCKALFAYVDSAKAYFAE